MPKPVAARRSSLQSPDRFELLFHGLPTAVGISTLPEGRLVDVNEPWLELFGFRRREEVIGRTSLELGLWAHPERRAELLDRLRADGILSNAETQARHKDGRTIELLSTLRIAEIDGQVCMLSSHVDITERKRAEMLLAAERQVFDELSHDAALEVVLDTLCRMMERASDGVLCSVLLLDETGQRLRHVAAPGLPVPYCQAINGTRIGPSVGSCGTAVYRREIVVVSDIDTDPLWTDFRGLALAHGLHACWSAPILGTGATAPVLGTFAMYYREQRAPTSTEIEFINRLAALAGIAIERRHAEESRARLERRFRTIFHSGPTAIGMGTIDEGRILEANDRYLDFFGYSRDEMIGRTVHELHLWADPDDRRRVIEVVHRVGRVVNVEVRFRRKSGDIRYGLFSMERIELPGESLQVAMLVDITQRKHAEELARESRERLKVLSERLLDVQETERRTISRELHDELGQALTAVKLNLQGIRRSSGAAIGGALDDSIEIVERAITSARDLSLQLRPSLLDDLGLAAALRWYADRVARRSELEATVTAQLPETRLPSALETACFRIAQEAVTNVARHAQATRFTVNLRQEAGALLLTVSDDGRGFDVAAVMRTPADGRSLGLVGMAERANLAGGELVIDSSPQRGTTVVVRVPLAPPG